MQTSSSVPLPAPIKCEEKTLFLTWQQQQQKLQQNNHFFLIQIVYCSSYSLAIVTAVTCIGNTNNDDYTITTNKNNRDDWFGVNPLSNFRFSVERERQTDREIEIKKKTTIIEQTTVRGITTKSKNYGYENTSTKQENKNKKKKGKKIGRFELFSSPKHASLEDH